MARLYLLFSHIVFSSSATDVFTSFMDYAYISLLVIFIGVNCPGMAGTVPDLEPQSLVPPGNCF